MLQDQVHLYNTPNPPSSRPGINIFNRAPMHLADHMLPHDYVPPDSPIFRFEARHLKRTKTRDDLIDFSRRRILTVMVIATLIWSLMVLWMSINDNPLATYEIIWQILAWGFLASLLDKFIVDFTVVTAGLDSVRKDVQGGQFDLVSLSSISTSHILESKFAAVQIQAWRPVVFIVALRLTLVWIGAITLFVLPLILWNTPDITNPYRDLVNSGLSPTSFVFVVCVIIGYGIAATIYIVEPRWRARALAAGSLAVSSQHLESTFGLLSALGVVIGVWMTQILMTAIAMFALAFTSFTLVSELAGGFYIIVYMFGVGLVIRALYRSLSRRWLNKAYRRMVRRGSAA